MDFDGRLQRLQSRLGEHQVDALLVTNLTNVRYLTGFSGTNAQLLVTPERRIFLTDPRYEARAAALVQDAEVVIYPARLTDALFPMVGQTSPVKMLGVEGKTITIDERDDLQKRLAGMDLVATAGLVEEMRRAKEPAEVDLIKEAVALGDRAFQQLLERLVPGVTEREVALEIEMTMRGWGAEEVSFPPIVGSGPLSAHIHHTAGDRELQKGDLVLLDFGCRWAGYCSDLTRTVVLGPATDEQRDMYDLVLRAQRAGIDGVRAGAHGQAVDAQARGVVEDAGSGALFAHGLGHGVGLEVHEAPRLSKISEDTLRAGDVVTVEPGVYVQGAGGIRIEDCVHVTPDGPEVLGTAPKDELIEL
ncbi:MAG: Xaa-Pro peptidase family protein [Actinomycetota bacterium]|nr:Xaa-Pro peptidase family protein [Actinomycetota bacterium]